MPGGWLTFLTALAALAIWLIAQKLRILDGRLHRAPTREQFQGLMDALERRVMERQERHEQQLDELRRPVQEGASALAEIRKDMQNGGHEVEGLQREIGELRRSLAQVEERLVGLTSQLESVTLAGAAPSSAAAPVEQIVHALSAQGYEDIRPYGPLPSSPAEEARVKVEARRAGASFKGSVLWTAGRVSDVRLQSSFRIFP